MTVQFATAYKTLLKHNTIPVFVHRNTIQDVEQHFTSCKAFKSYQPVVNHFLRVYDEPYAKNIDDDSGSLLQEEKEESYYDQFKVGKSLRGTLLNLSSMLRIRGCVRRGFDYRVPCTDRVDNLTRLHAFFLVSNGRVVHEIRPNSLGIEPDLARMLDFQYDSTTDNCVEMLKSLEEFNRNRIFVEQFVDGELFIQELERRRRSTSRLSCYSVPTTSSNVDKDKSEIEQFVENPLFRRYFKVYCTRELSVESLLFYECVVEYKKLDMDRRLQVIPKIYDLFFARNSIYELNVTNKIVNECTEKLETDGATDDLFDELVIQVIMNLRDAFKRFQRSAIYIEAKNQLN
jgi:hypothetical protein